MKLDDIRLIRVTRLILTSIILFLLTWYYQVPEREWSLITLWFVMLEYTYAGGVYKKSFYRFVGTFCSAVYGMIVIYYGANNVIINIIAFILAVIVYCYFFLDTEQNYIAVIGCVTLSITLLNHNDIDAAVLRTFNIILGIIAAVFMTRFFYPRYAHHAIEDSNKNVVSKVCNFLHNYLNFSIKLSAVQQKNAQLLITLQNDLNVWHSQLNDASFEIHDANVLLMDNQQSFNVLQQLLISLRLIFKAISTEDIRIALSQSPYIKDSLLKLEQLKQGSHLVTTPAIEAESEKTIAIQPLTLILKDMWNEVEQLTDIRRKRELECNEENTCST